MVRFSNPIPAVYFIVLVNHIYDSSGSDFVVVVVMTAKGNIKNLHNPFTLAPPHFKKEAKILV